MECKRIDENTLCIYLNEDDMIEFNLNVQDFFGPDQETAQELISDILKEADPDGEFLDQGQLSIQIMPHKNGLQINVHKFKGDEDPKEMMKTLLRHLPKDHLSEIMDVMKQVESQDEGRENQQEEKQEVEEYQQGALIGTTDNFDDIIQLAHLKQDWDGFSQAVYWYHNRYYLAFAKMIKSADDESEVLNEAAVMSEWLHVDVYPYNEIMMNGENLLPDHADDLMAFLDQTFQ